MAKSVKQSSGFWAKTEETEGDKCSWQKSFYTQQKFKNEQLKNMLNYHHDDVGDVDDVVVSVSCILIRVFGVF